MKECKTCNTEKELTEFFACSKTKAGYRPNCKTCTQEKDKARRQANPEKQRKIRRKAHLKAKYGVTPEWLEQRLEELDHKCPLCATPIAEGYNLAIDHCHTTGEVRDVVCRSCNIAMGMFKDNPELIEKAVQYLKDNKDV